MKHIVTPLPTETWKNSILPMDYISTAYYDIHIESGEALFGFHGEKVTLEEPILHKDSEKEILYSNDWKNAFAWGIVESDALIAAVETCPEEWSNRLRITKIWVDFARRKQGLGHALMAVAKEQAIRENRRAVILETQSCNTNAIDFYLGEGFCFIGLDICAYNNCDVEKKEVRLELGWFPK